MAYIPVQNISIFMAYYVQNISIFMAYPVQNIRIFMAYPVQNISIFMAMMAHFLMIVSFQDLSLDFSGATQQYLIYHHGIRTTAVISLLCGSLMFI